MDTKKSIAKWIEYYRQKFSLQEWEISVEYVKDIEGSPAAISVTEQYRQAKVMAVLRLLTTDKYIKMVMKHELLHIFHAEFDRILYRALQVYIDELESAGDTLWNMSRDASERLVTRIERLID